jgi:hypothetical protein
MALPRLSATLEECKEWGGVLRVGLVLSERRMKSDLSVRHLRRILRTSVGCTRQTMKIHM